MFLIEELEVKRLEGKKLRKKEKKRKEKSNKSIHTTVGFIQIQSKKHTFVSLTNILAKMAICPFQQNFSAFCSLSQTILGNASVLKFDNVRLDFHIKLDYLIRELLRGCLVCVFKQYYTYFHTLFHSNKFSHMFLNNHFQFLNTCTKWVLKTSMFIQSSQYELCATLAKQMWLFPIKKCSCMHA